MNARPPEREDLDAVLDALVTMAEGLLKKRGTFHPVGAAMTTTGQVVYIYGNTGSHHPVSTDVIELLRDGMRSQAAAGEIKASGICSDVTLRGEHSGDAIAVELEHRDGDCVEVVMPYSKRRFRAPLFSDMSSTPGQPRIFGDRERSTDT